MADTGNWANLTLNQEISATTISVGWRHFTPATNTTGSPHAPIGFKVGNETLFSGPYTLAIHAINSSAIAAITANGNTCIPFDNSGTLLGEFDNRGSGAARRASSQLRELGGLPV